MGNIASKITSSVERGEPIVLDLRFDPGWTGLRDHYEAKASLQTTPRYVSRILNKDHSRFNFKSTGQFLDLAEQIRQVSPDALSHTYVHYENDLRKYDDFVIGQTPQKVLQLRTSFHSAEPYISNIPNHQFLENYEDDTSKAKEREQRALNFPRFILFQPSKETMRQKKGSTQPLISTCLTREGLDEERAIGIYNLDIKDKNLKHIIAHNELSGLIIVPYARPKQVNDCMENAFIEEGSSMQFPMIQGKVSNKNQFAQAVPESFRQSLQLKGSVAHYDYPELSQY